MIKQCDLSFLNLEPIRQKILQIETSPHGLVTKGVSTYNHGMPILMYTELAGLKTVVERVVSVYCRETGIAPLKLINSWFNISQPGSKLKAHKHEESIVSGAFYLSGKAPLVFPDISITPYPGLLIIFPSDLIHHTNEEIEQRMIISFNTHYL
jgi:hypothetical protein